MVGRYHLLLSICLVGMELRLYVWSRLLYTLRDEGGM